jgi:hypothetical protein
MLRVEGVAGEAGARRVGMTRRTARYDRPEEVRAIEAQFQSLQEQITAIQTAQSTATAAARESARINSYPNPGLNIVPRQRAALASPSRLPPIPASIPVQGTIDVADVAITGGTLPGLAAEHPLLGLLRRHDAERIPARPLSPRATRQPLRSARRRGVTSSDMSIRLPADRVEVPAEFGRFNAGWRRWSRR